MKQHQSATNVAAIRRAHGQFLSEGRVPRGIVPDFIERSWKRSAAAGVAYDRIREIGRIDEVDLRTVVSQYGNLINLATPVMKNLHHQLSGSGSVVLLCSDEGLILHSLGDPDFLPKAQHIALKPGVSWAENQKGTNAICAAIIERQPVVIYAGHHYIRQNQFLACSAAPVLDPFGQVAGVLDITCDYRFHQRHTLALVQMSVRVIERQIFQHRFSRDLVFNAHPEQSYLGSPFDVQVAFSPDGDFLAATPATCSQLGLQPDGFRGRFEELFDAPFEQVLDKLRSTSPPFIQVCLRQSGEPVFLQLAHPAVPRQVVPGTALESSPPNRPAAGERPRQLLTLEALGTPDSALLVTIDKARRTLGRDIPILVEGETGTGKEWFARAIHNSGPSSHGEFVAVRCSESAGDGAETELFGDLLDENKDVGRGAVWRIWTGGGTLFLDEIGEMSLRLQARLLRALEGRTMGARVGGSSSADIAVICATQYRLLDRVQAGRFREDLFYCLDGLSVTLPPLRMRTDLLTLARAIIEQEKSPGREIKLSDEVGQIFERHPWPGNLRQLRSVIRTAIAMVGDGPTIERAHLPDRFLEMPVHQAGSCVSTATETRPESLDQIERHAMVEAIRCCDGNIAAAARRLNVSRTTLYRRLKADAVATDAANRQVV